ncbi:D-glucuronyl C5-epimerase family protein [Bordetella hinzii]|uniref:D-glucuronyl C5-epimerase family protein n=1 Tax=Bordetella hinzii TaxID=103855 RepID=UPI00045A916E|nr:D-glucuronyl C5-epimerase family protein [Bordetella hinzii]KCB47964.1 D-glucuronyl C5-epimerase C-terminal domain protein [Bordetella hinzii 4161]KXA74343.1 hypothetical protein AXA74_02640 [Bordetella hinzii LMG 13501]QDJ35623.1 hypothetical protein CBR67_02585 [Bordetella hinzii]VEH32448.1 D-glucuronyl C5-epimerase C-terminus [Bordetella hinzii]
MRWKLTATLLAAVALSSLVTYFAVRTEQEDSGYTLPAVTMGANNELGIPAVVDHPNNKFLRPFYAERAGLRVTYEKQIFSPQQPAMMYVPADIEGRTMLPWRTSENGKPGLYGLYPGNTLVLLDNKLYDLGVGTLFIKVRNESAKGLTGFVPADIVIGETAPADDTLWRARDVARLKDLSVVSIDGVPLYAILRPTDDRDVARQIAILSDPSKYDGALGGGQPGIHPVAAANTVYGILVYALRPDTDSTLRASAISAAQKFFDAYAFPKADQIKPGVVAWPYTFEWNLNWGIKLSPPWYSAYANAVMAAAASILFKETGEEKYRQLALASLRYLDLPVQDGGAKYTVSGFQLPAEYVYPSPPIPNVRVLDGELIAAVATYNAARLLGNSWALALFQRQAYSLAMQMDFYTRKDGRMLFATYVEEMPEHYQWILWSNLQALGNITKDRRFSDTADRLKPHINKTDCQQKGC